MSITLQTVVDKYLASKRLSDGTCKEYRATVTKWIAWGNGVDLCQIERSHIREFLDWVHDRAKEDGGTNAGRTANKARENLRAMLSWAWEQDLVEKLPRLPKPKPQRDVAGRHYLTKADLNALYFATHKMKRPRGWKQPLTVGHYWRAALVVFLITVSIPGRYLGARPFTNPFFGDTLLGIRNHQMVKEKNLVMVGCTIDELKPKSSFTDR